MPCLAEGLLVKLFSESFLRLFSRSGIMQIMTLEENREKQRKPAEVLG